MLVTNLTDIELLHLIQQGDSAAFKALYLRLWKPLFVFVMKRLRSEEDAADVVQEVFASLWNKRQSIAIQESVRGYIYTAAKYKVMDQVNSMLQSPANFDLLQDSLHPLSSGASDMLISKEMESILQGEVNALPGKMKQIYLLHIDQDLSVTDIACRLDLSERTIRNQLNLAKKRLKSSLKQALFLCFFW